MKTLKRVLPLILAFTLTCFAFACGGANTPATHFDVTVTYENGAAVNGLTDGNAGVTADGKAGTEIKVQFCKLNEDGTLGSCSTPATLGEYGKYSVKIADLEAICGAGDFELHLLGVKDEYEYETKTVVNAKNAKVTIVLKLKTK